MPAILGTAGHIDHGKTALVRALTGQDTDRLKEEKERGISIDLGFAWLDLPGGGRAGIVDVPGHERFIRNMLAGAHGIDVVLLVVAADDGVMPQTEEHLEIIHLLGIERGIAVISKADLVSEARLREVEGEVSALLAGTRLAGAPVLAVSSVTGAGLERLRAEIERQLALASERCGAGAFRLPIDRAFVQHGHGVVVTGTATGGAVREGAVLRLLPDGEECRVRSLEVHGQRVVEAVSGQRVALNLAGVERTDVRRGHLLADARLRLATTRLDALVEILPGAGSGLRNLATVRLHHGTASSPARVHLLDGRAELRPKERGFAQIVLDEELAPLVGDRFVLRDETVRRTLGGGVVLRPRAPRHRRGDGTAERLAAIASAADLPTRLAALLHASGEVATEVEELLQSLPEGEAEIAAALRQAPDLVLLPSPDAPEVALTRAAVEKVEADIVAHLAEAHRAAPTSPGVEMESVRAASASALRPRLFRTLVDELVRRERVARDESVLRLASHRARLAAPERALAERVERALVEGALTPPDTRQIEAELGIAPRRLADVLAQLERDGRAVRVAPDLWYAAPAFEQARARLTSHLQQHGEITAAAFRDLIRASRKFSIALLDHFDRIGFTLRVGDVRKLRRRS